MKPHDAHLEGLSIWNLLNINPVGWLRVGRIVDGLGWVYSWFKVIQK